MTTSVLIGQYGHDMTRRRRHPSLVPFSHDHRDALGLAFRLHHPAPPGPVTARAPGSPPERRAADAGAFCGDHRLAHFRPKQAALSPFLRSRLADQPERPAPLAALPADHRELEARRDAVAAATGDALAPALTA